MMKRSYLYAVGSLLLTAITVVVNLGMAKAQQEEMTETINEAFDDQRRRIKDEQNKEE